MEIKETKGLTNEMQGITWLSTWLSEHANRLMDDDLDALGLQTIQELKKPSEENANQTSI